MCANPDINPSPTPLGKRFSELTTCTGKWPIVLRSVDFPELTLSQRSRELTRLLRGCVLRGSEAVRALR